MGLNISPSIWQSYINAILDCLETRKHCEVIMDNLLLFTPTKKAHTGGSRLSQIFWEHENQSSLLVIRLIYIKLYRKKETKFWRKKIRAKWESGLTTVWLKWDPPVWQN